MKGIFQKFIRKTLGDLSVTQIPPLTLKLLFSSNLWVNDRASDPMFYTAIFPAPPAISITPVPFCNFSFPKVSMIQFTNRSARSALKALFWNDQSGDTLQ